MATLSQRPFNAMSAQQNAKQLPWLSPFFDAFMNKTMQDFHIPGASVAVIHNDGIETKGYGHTRPDGPPVTSTTLFQAASMTKSFTAGAIALLVQDNEKYPLIQWDTPVSSVLREDFVLSDRHRTESVTIRDILCHRTGLAGQDPISHGVESTTPDTPASITRKLRHLDLTKPFRTDFQYCNLLYTAATHLLETVTSTPLSQFWHENFFQPLGMTHSQTGSSSFPSRSTLADPSSNIALPYHYSESQEKFTPFPYLTCPEAQGAGNILSTARDWAQYLSSYIHNHPSTRSSPPSTSHPSPLTPISIHELTTPHIPMTPTSFSSGHVEPNHSPMFYCLGWEVEYYRGHTVIGHSGGIPGTACLMRYIPEKRFGMVVFGNAGGMSEASEVIWWKLVDDLLDVPEGERMDWVARMGEDDDDDDDEDGVFKTRADPALPLPVRLEELAGSYRHEAYGLLEFEVSGDGKQLIANAEDRTFGFELRLTHVSHVFFEAEMWEQYGEESSKMEAEVRIGVDGRVEELGVDFIDEDGSKLVWFRRDPRESTDALKRES